jgi:hypothetical protein
MIYYDRVLQVVSIDRHGTCPCRRGSTRQDEETIAPGRHFVLYIIQYIYIYIYIYPSGPHSSIDNTGKDTRAIYPYISRYIPICPYMSQYLYLRHDYFLRRRKSPRHACPQWTHTAVVERSSLLASDCVLLNLAYDFVPPYICIRMILSFSFLYQLMSCFVQADVFSTFKFDAICFIEFLTF